MNGFVCALRRCLGRPLLFLLLAVCTAAVALAGTVGEAAETPPAGVCAGENSEASRRVLSWLLENGFVQYSGEEELRTLVERGELNCAVILPTDLTRRLEQGDLAGCAQWIESPSSYAPELSRYHVAAALFREYAPYLSARSFEGTGVTREELLAEYEQMFAEGFVFSFELLTTQQGKSPTDVKRQSLVTGAAAILLCAVMFSFCADSMDDSFRALLGRLGLYKTVTGAVLPGMLVRAVLAACAGCAGVLLAGVSELLLPLVIYVFLLAGIALILAALLPGIRQLYLLLALLTLCAAAVCPIYIDPAQVLPWLSGVRCLLPPYWLWLIPKHPALWCAAALLAWPVGLGTLCLRYAWLGKYSLRRRKRN